MSWLWRALITLLGLALVGAIGGVFVFQLGFLNLSMQELEQRYSTAESRFIDVDGVRTHYMDQGSGPPVVLLHASLMNLYTWDSLSRALSPDYRVIRMDRLLSGLTGPDPKGEYTVDREIELLDGLLKQLGVEHFHLIATSSGGTTGFRYASRYPDRVASLTLINSAGLPRTAATNPNRSRGTPWARWARKYYRSKDYWRDTLDDNFVEPNEPPEWLVDIVYDSSRRDTLAEEVGLYMKNYQTGDPEAVLSKITSPTLILWGMENATVMHLEADVFAYWLVNSAVTKKKYPEAAHYLYLEIPDEFEADVGEFLSRQTLTTEARVGYSPAL